MQLTKKIVAGALMVLALGGIGAGVASAATPATGSSTTAPAAAVVDTAVPAGSADEAGSVDADNLQQGDQSGPDTASLTGG